MAQYRKDLNQYLPQEKTIFETVMLADQYGNVIGGANPSGMAVDAFGRARMSQPLTLFDSFHRYQDNGKVGTGNTAGTTVTHDPNSSSIVCSLPVTANAYVYRESNRVFAYQPGKSLQIFQTFVLNPAQTNLRQRVGFFGKDNGLFLEQSNSAIRFVRRSNTTGTIVETVAEKADWNVDTLDGTNTGAWTENPPTANRNPSGINLDLTKAQILFTDIEWLGVGSVRQGFVINGKLVHCHTWHHANLANNTYMTTACLPVRAEIENTGTTANTSNLRVICTTVISEGGYDLRGRPRTVGHEPNSAYDLTTAGTYYPIACLKLKSDRPDGLVIPRDIKIAGTSASGTIIKYKVVVGANVSNGVWVDAGSDSSVLYNMNATSYTGGTDYVSGYLTITNQSSSPVTLDNQLFRYQLERNSMANSNTIFVVAAAGQKNGDDILACIDWEEIT